MTDSRIEEYHQQLIRELKDQLKNVPLTAFWENDTMFDTDDLKTEYQEKIHEITGEKPNSLAPLYRLLMNICRRE